MEFVLYHARIEYTQQEEILRDCDLCKNVSRFEKESRLPQKERITNIKYKTDYLKSNYIMRCLSSLQMKKIGMSRILTEG